MLSYFDRSLLLWIMSLSLNNISFSKSNKLHRRRKGVPGMQYLFSQTESRASETCLTMNDRLPLPSDVLCSLDFAPCSSFLLHGLQCEGYTLVIPRFPVKARRDSLYQHINAGVCLRLVRAAQLQWTLEPVSTVKHHAFGLLLSLRLWERLSRRRGGDACSHFFPRFVGFGPTDSSANGAFVIQPSTLSHV